MGETTFDDIKAKGDITATDDITVMDDFILKDDGLLTFGTSNDFTIEWDTALTPDGLLLMPAADNTVVNVGNGTLSCDLIWYGGNANTFVKFDCDGDTVGSWTFGADGYGMDCWWYGTDTGVLMGWDKSENELSLTGTKIVMTMGSNANTSGSATAFLRASTTAVARFYGDDGGADLFGTGSVPDIRTLFGRCLITHDQTGGNVRTWGVMGNWRLYDALYNNEQAGGVCGRVELVQASGTTTVAGNGITAGVTGVLATAGTVLINTNHVSAAVAAVADIKGTVTQTGKAVGVYVAPYDTTNWSDATSRAKFGYGIHIHQDAATRGIFVGTSGSNTTSGLPMGGATCLNGFYADDSGAAQTASTVWRNMEARTYISAAQSNAAADMYSIRGHMKVASGINLTGDTSVKAAIHGYFELAGATTVGAGSFASAVEGEIWTDGNLVGTGKVAGVMSRFYSSAGTVSGTTAAFMATKQWASTQNWPYGLYIDAATIDIRLNGGPCILSGSGDPNGAVTAPLGSLYVRSDPSNRDTNLYMNTNGTTGWSAAICAS